MSSREEAGFLRRRRVMLRDQRGRWLQTRFGSSNALPMALRNAKIGVLWQNHVSAPFIVRR
jgi:hypothetical protein